jgi:hypothetical protein
MEPDGSYTEHVTFYPPAGQNLATRKVYESIPYQLEQLYSEVIETFNTGAYLLCAAGLRALIEGICTDKLPGKRGNLRTKINALVDIIPPKIIGNLHGFRFLGNNALHQLATPTRKELALAIEVVEDILNVVYELDYKSGRLFQLLQRKQAKYQ